MSSADELVGGSAASINNFIQNLQKLNSMIIQIINQPENYVSLFNYINAHNANTLTDITTMQNHLKSILGINPISINDVILNLLQLRAMVTRVIEQGENNINVNYINDNYDNTLNAIIQMQTRLRLILRYTNTNTHNIIS